MWVLLLFLIALVLADPPAVQGGLILSGAAGTGTGGDAFIDQTSCEGFVNTNAICRDSNGDAFQSLDGVTTIPFPTPGSGTPSTWQTTMTQGGPGVGNVYRSANDPASALLVTRNNGSPCSGEGGWRMYVDAAGNPTLQACSAAGALLARDVHIYAGQTYDQTIDTAGTPASCYSTDDTGKVTISPNESCGVFAGAVRVEGPLSGLTGIKTISTNPYTMVATDCGKMLFLATGAGEIRLLADPTTGVANSGCMVCFDQVSALTADFEPNGTDTIIAASAGLTLAPGDRLRLASGAGNHVCLLGVNATTWRTYPGVGALSVNP